MASQCIFSSVSPELFIFVIPFLPLYNTPQDEKTLFSLLNSKEELYNTNFDNDKVLKVLEKINKKKFYLCQYPSLSQNQALIGAVKYIVDNNISSTDEIPKDYVYDYLTELVVHEVGHTLGLRHNFKSSSA